MKKTFLLGAKPWLYIFIGSLFLFNAGLAYFDAEQSRIDYWLMVLNFLVGIYAIAYGLFVQTSLFGTAPRVDVYNEGVFLKSKAFGSGREVKWDEIKSISFHSFQIDFKLDTEPIFFTYKSTAATSKKIKEAIRDMAEMKGITVTGG